MPRHPVRRIVVEARNVPEPPPPEPMSPSQISRRTALTGLTAAAAAVVVPTSASAARPSTSALIDRTPGLVRPKHLVVDFGLSQSEARRAVHLAQQLYTFWHT